jgi:Na+/melibiose symporter-like transporter
MAINAFIIALIATLYLTKFIDSKEVYMIWICLIYFVQCGTYVLMPTITAKCFGQKNFGSIYGFMALCGVEK